MTFLFPIFLLLALTAIVTAIQLDMVFPLHSFLLLIAWPSLSVSHFKKALGTGLHLNEVCPSKASVPVRKPCSFFSIVLPKSIEQKKEELLTRLNFQNFQDP